MHTAFSDKKPFQQHGHSYGHPLFPKAHKIFPKAQNLWEYQMLSSDEWQAACSMSLMSTSTFTSTERGNVYVEFTVVLERVLTAQEKSWWFKALLPCIMDISSSSTMSQPGEFWWVEQKGPWLGASIVSLLSKEWISPHPALQFSHSLFFFVGGEGWSKGKQQQRSTNWESRDVRHEVTQKQS